MIRYAVSKAAVVMFTKELQARLDRQGVPVVCMSVHPKEVLTEGVLAINTTVVKSIAKMTFITPEQGATTPLFAATAEEVLTDTSKYRGAYIEPVGKVISPNPVAEDDEQVKGL